jgi:tripartite motif-containing protein 71
VLRRIGTKGRDPGQFSAITGLSVDAQGQLLVTDAQAVPVQMFSSEGTLLLSFGAHDVGWHNFSLPYGVVSDGAGSIWVVDAVRQVVTRFDGRGRYTGVIGGLGVNVGDMYYPVAIAGDGARRLFVLEKNGARFQVFDVAP